MPSPPVRRPLALPILIFCLPLSSAAASGGLLLTDAGLERRFESVQEAGKTVLYETGGPRTAYSRRVVTGAVLVRLEHPDTAAAVAAACGAADWRLAPVLQDAVILTFPADLARVIPAVEKLAGLPGVHSAEPVLARQQVKRWIPNDPYFSDNASNAGYAWHLRNTGGRGGLAGVDINVAPVWDTWRGAGIRIGIVDDGLELTHPDLAANVDTAHDYDWNGSDDDPSPNALDDHGTACAGLAAARGNNSAGLCGAAPEATLVGLRLISSLSDDTTESAAFLHRNDIIQVKNNSWGPDDTGSVVEGPGPLGAAALQQAAETGRGGLGTIIVWAAGNGRSAGDDSNYDGYANSLYTIAVGSVTDAGVQASYSEPGANVLICTPSGGGSQGLSTTDRTGSGGYNAGSAPDYSNADYTNDFDGTSASAPVAAGAVALILQSRPGLGWRDMKEILLRSAVQVSPADAGWLTNAAGFHFNDKFGAGLLNTAAAVTQAGTWKNLGPMVSTNAQASPAAAIPDNSPAGVSVPFTLPPSQNMRVEQVTVTVNVTHPRRGQLNYTLTSPAGTVSRLARPRPDNNPDLAWTFSTPQFWGESAAGTWTLRVSDNTSARTGTLNTAGLAVYGSFPDADGDGYTAAMEEWFGTSDASGLSRPELTISRPGSGLAITFPSVAGRVYIMETSGNLTAWAQNPVTGAANASQTTWTDPNPVLPGRRYYRVRMP